MYQIEYWDYSIGFHSNKFQKDSFVDFLQEYMKLHSKSIHLHIDKLLVLLSYKHI